MNEPRENADILILTLEQLSDLLPTVLSNFVGAKLQARRDRVEKSDVYAEVKERLCLPEPVLRCVYDHSYMCCFYTEEDIGQFIRRWSGEEGP